METTTVLNRETAAVRSTARRGVMPVLLTATFMTALDFFIVNVALPSLQTDLRAGPAALQWVVAGFGLALAAGLITGGRLGDIYGRRRIFGIGIALFTLASLLCGTAPTAAFLVGARVLQGLGAALLMPQTLAFLRSAVPPAAQPKAFARYGLALGLGAVFGQVIGGLLIKIDLFELDWRLWFLINLPIGVGVLAALRALPSLRDAGRPRQPARPARRGAGLGRAGGAGSAADSGSAVALATVDMARFGRLGCAARGVRVLSAPPGSAADRSAAVR